MGFKSTILVVQDVLKSRKLYEKILGCKVVDDFGIYNVGFEGGLALYKSSLFSELIGPDKKIIQKANNISVYFEFENIFNVEAIIRKEKFESIHKIKEEPWGQNVFRFYDFDNHIIEVGEMMENVVQRLHDSGLTIQGIAEKTGYSETIVLEKLNKTT